MDRQEASRLAAQHALLDALRRLCPKPLAELRDGLPAVTKDGGDRPSARSQQRETRIREARGRVRALPVSSVEDRRIVLVDVDAWAARWRLHALCDLAPHLTEYWGKRPSAAARFYFPKLRPLPPTPRLNPALEPHDPAQPILADPDLESEDDFLARARAHYQRRAGVLSVRPHHRRRRVLRHAVWYVRSQVQGWTAERIAEEATTANDAPDVSTVRKGIAEFTRLLSTSRK